MGEVNTGQENGGKAGILPKSKKLSTRVDMTPVVDLAFLLLTFFMLATTFIKPEVMALVLPQQEKDQIESKLPKVNEKNVLNIVLDGENRIYWYVGLTEPQVQETDYSAEGIRRVLTEHRLKLEKLVVLVKPDNTATYENMVDILDELKITSISRYALVDMGEEDRSIMASYLGGETAQEDAVQGAL
jgi:biopolymer transport protein ExbD